MKKLKELREMRDGNDEKINNEYLHSRLKYILKFNKKYSGSKLKSKKFTDPNGKKFICIEKDKVYYGSRDYLNWFHVDYLINGDVEFVSDEDKVGFLDNVRTWEQAIELLTVLNKNLNFNGRFVLLDDFVYFDMSLTRDGFINSKNQIFLSDEYLCGKELIGSIKWDKED